MQLVVFRAVRFDYAAGGTSWRHRPARALPYNWLCFVQSASVLQQAELAECAADGKSLAVQLVDLRAVRFGFAADGTSWRASASGQN